MLDLHHFQIRIRLIPDSKYIDTYWIQTRFMLTSTSSSYYIDPHIHIGWILGPD